MSATITDESEIFEPTLYYRQAGTKRFLSASMTKGNGAEYSATIPEAAMSGVVEYFIEAYDVNGNGPGRFASDRTPHKIKTVKAEPAKVSETLPPPPPPAETRPDETRPAESKPTPQAATSSAQPAVERRADGRGKIVRIVGIAAAGLGAGGLVAGTVLGLKSRSLHDDAVTDPSAYSANSKLSDSKKMATGATAAFIVGGVVAAAGVALAVLPSLISFDSSSSGERSLESSLSLGPSGATLTLRF